jgi:general stress protein 26
VVEDPARKKMLWSAEAASWFEGGPEDPGLALIRVRIIQADCWDVESNQVTPLFILDNGTMPFKSPFDQGNRGLLRH